MSPQEHENYASLDPFEWNRYQELIDNYEDAWNTSEPESFDAYLPPADDPHRLAVLRELIKSDLEIRWRKGRPVRLESYLDRYPELGTVDSLSTQTIYEEYRVRRLYGDQPELDDYRDRFPEQFARFEQLVADQPVDTPSGASSRRPPQEEAHPKTERGSKVEKTIPPEEAAKLENPSNRSSKRPASTHRGSSVRSSKFASGVWYGDEKYTVGKRLGAGTFGEVYEGEARGGIPIAIKRLFKPIEAEEAQRELQSLELIKKMAHPFLISTHEFWIDEDGYLLTVTELADGTLRDRLRECKPNGIPPEELIEYFVQSAKAMDYLHQNDILHRDIKPENILLQKGFAKVADFGLARRSDLNSIVADATFAGTLAYMPPEVFNGEVSRKSDQYSLAVTYAELRMGRRPFPSGSPMEMVMGATARDPNFMGLPKEEQEVLGKALAKKPRERYGSCEEWALALRRALIQSGTIQGEVPPPPPPGGLKRILVGIVGAVFLLGLLVWGIPRIIDLIQEKPHSDSPPFYLVLDDLERGLYAAGGEAKSVTIEVGRYSSKKPISLSFPNLPDHVVVETTDIPEVKDQTTVRVVVGPDAPKGPTKITISATDGDHTEKREVKLPIAARTYPLPEGWKKAKGAKLVEVPSEDRVYYDKIDVHKGGHRIPLVLVPRGAHDEFSPTSIPSYYMMESKVWLGLFRTFANELKAEREKLRDSGWSTLPTTKPLNWHDEHPVMGVTAPDADQFARWLGMELPSPEQWDKAVGGHGIDWSAAETILSGDHYVRMLDQVSATALASTNVLGAIPYVVFRGTTARGKFYRESPFGVEDMAGNGLEWTGRAQLLGRKLLNGGFKILDKDDRVFTRGLSFFPPFPTTGGSLVEGEKNPPVPSDAKRKVDIGFRAVFKPWILP